MKFSLSGSFKNLVCLTQVLDSSYYDDNVTKSKVRGQLEIGKLHPQALLSIQVCASRDSGHLGIPCQSGSVQVCRWCLGLETARYRASRHVTVPVGLVTILADSEEAGQGFEDRD